MSTDNDRSAADSSAAELSDINISMFKIANSLRMLNRLGSVAQTLNEIYEQLLVVEEKITIAQENNIKLLAKIALAQTNMALKTDVNSASAEVKKVLDRQEAKENFRIVSTDHPDFN